MSKSNSNSVCWSIRISAAEKSAIAYPFMLGKFDEKKTLMVEIEALIAKVLEQQLNCLRKN